MDHYITILLGDREHTQQAGNALYFLFRAYLPTDVVVLTALLVQGQVWSDGWPQLRWLFRLHLPLRVFFYLNRQTIWHVLAVSCQFAVRESSDLEACALSWVVCGHGPSGRELVTSDDPSSVEVGLGAASQSPDHCDDASRDTGCQPDSTSFLISCEKTGGGLH